MHSNFSRSLSLLRQEKGISQRLAAQELGISQALLSHYENGVREPGLAFVVRACEYYHVSADFLLGRTLVRDETTLHDTGSASCPEDIPSVGKQAAQSVALLFKLLSKTGRQDLTETAAHYMNAAIYTLFRHLYRAEQRGSEDIFPVPSHAFLHGAARLELTRAELEYTATLEDTRNIPDLRDETLTQEEPVLYPSLLRLLYDTNQRILKHLKR